MIMESPWTDNETSFRWYKNHWMTLKRQWKADETTM